jgi:hypothetical protein
MPITLPAQAGEAATHHGITLVPLFPRRNPAADYLTLRPALRRGLVVTERGAEGSVPELLVANPLRQPVLLYDGEELLGAKQNRILNLTVLVAAESRTPIPVSCVEAGRWRRSSVAFAAAAHTAGPELRLRKARALGTDALARGVAQHEVWDAVADQAGRRGVVSATAAHAAMFTQHEAALADLRADFPLQPGQCGSVVVLPDGRACLDYLSRPDAYAEHHVKLLDGYLMDALDQVDRPPVGAEPSNRLVHRLSLAAPERRRSAGLGLDLRAQTKSLTVTGLELDGELLQLSAYA